MQKNLPRLQKKKKTRKVRRKVINEDGEEVEVEVEEEFDEAAATAEYEEKIAAEKAAAELAVKQAAADAEDEPPKTPVKRQKQTKAKATPAPPVAEQTEDDAWAQCDACQKWRLLPKDHVVDEGKQWTCSLAGRSCDERADDACARHQLVRESQSDDERGNERRRDGGVVPETRRRVVPPAGGMATPVHHRAQRDDDGTATTILPPPPPSLYRVERVRNFFFRGV